MVESAVGSEIASTTSLRVSWNGKSFTTTLTMTPTLTPSQHHPAVYFGTANYFFRHSISQQR